MKSITEGSRAVFTFGIPAEVEGNGYSTTAQDWVDMEVTTSLNNCLGLEALTNLEGHHIIIGKSSLNGYYDITFTSLYDLDGETPLQFKDISDVHFTNVFYKVKIAKTDRGSDIANEKSEVLRNLFKEMDDKYVSDENILTNNMLDILINKCNQLKKSDF